MGSSCVRTARVRNKEGKFVNSKLFSDLNEITDHDRNLTVSIYGKIKTQKFSDLFGDKIEKDENGEPTLSSLLKKTDIEKLISEKTIKESIIKKFDLKKESEIKFRDRDEELELYSKSVSVNINNFLEDNYLAVVKKEDSGKSFISIVKKSLSSLKEKATIESELSLHDFLAKKLETAGIKIGCLTDLEKRMNVNGVSDFSVCKEATKGFIEAIRLAEGEKGERALPEEFSHFAIEALENKNPLVKRLIDVIIKKNLAKEIIGEDYEQYEKTYNGNKEKIAKEAAGKLLAESIQNEYKKVKEEVKEKRLVDRIFTAFKSLLKKFDTKDFKKALTKAETISNELAKNIINNTANTEIDLSEITSKEKYYQQGSQKITKEQEVLQGIIDDEKKKLESMINKKVSQASINRKKRQIDELVFDLNNNEIKNGIYSFVMQNQYTTKYLIAEANKINKDPSLSILQKLKKIRRLQVYAESRTIIFNSLSEEIRLFDNMSEKDRDYLTALCEKEIGILSSLSRTIDRVTNPVLYSFFKDYCPDKIEITTGPRKGEFITIADEMEMIDGDISWKNRWMDSMEDSGDLILSIIARITKMNKEEARMDTNECRSEIDEMDAALKQSHEEGTSDTSFMFARNSDGKKTGEYISEEDSNYLGKAQKKYYDSFMALKKRLDGKLPPGRTSPSSTIKIRKDAFERLTSSMNVIKNFIILCREQFVVNDNDTATMGAKNVLRDASGRRLRTIPIYMLNVADGETEEDMSEDCSGCLLQYASMVNNYDHMNEILDGLETARDYLAKTRRTAETAGDGSALKDKNGDVVFKGTDEGKNWLDRLDDFLTMEVFGNENGEDSNLVWKISKKKTVNFLIKATALNQLSFNLNSEISNLTTGRVNLLIEQIGAKNFGTLNLAIADKNLAEATGQCILEIGSPIKTNKLSLFDRTFNVTQTYEEDVAENYTRGRLSRAIDPSIGLIGQKIGDSWLQNRTALALADTIKLKDSSGEEHSLWDSLEVKYKNPSEKTGAYLAVKDGYVKADGTQFSRKDFASFSLLNEEINNKLYGIYNHLDKSAIQQYSFGKVLCLFRKYLVPNLNKRYGKASYNINTGRWEEPYYTTLFHVAKALALAKKKNQTYKEVFNSFNSDEEKANIKMSITELSVLSSLVILLALIGKSGEDPKNNTWTRRMAKYQLVRLKTEIGALTPTPYMISEGITLLDSPTAVTSLFKGIEKGKDIFKTDEIVRSGQFKGKSKSYKAIHSMPLPYFSQKKQIYKSLHPEEGIKFFDSDTGEVN